MEGDTTAQKGTPNPRDLIQSIEKGLAVIRAFSAERQTLTLADVSRETGLSRAATRRILLTLQALGYVGSRGREYFLLPRVLDLGYSYVSSAGLTGLIQPHLDALSEEVQEGCAAGVLSRDQVVYVARTPSRRLLKEVVPVGVPLDAFATAMGRVLLAGLEDAEVERLLRDHPPTAHTPFTETDPVQLLAAIRQVREQGWSVVAEELELGFVVASVPLRSPAGNVVAALNVASPASRVTPEHAASTLVPVLQHAAAAIERDLLLHPQPF